MVEVNIGAAANDGTGDPLRTAFAKVNADITTLKTGLAAIEQVPDAVALTQAVADAEASAVSAASDAELVDTALANTSNAIFGVGDSGAGLTYDVMIADRVIVSESSGTFPQIQVEIEPGTVVALLKAGAVDDVNALVNAAAASAAAADTSADEAAASAASAAAVIAISQPLDADLTALAALTATGLLVRTGAGTAAARSLATGGANITITNANGVAGNPTVALTPGPLTEIGGLTPVQGDLLYRNATVVTRLAKGTAGQALRMNAGGTEPEWGNINPTSFAAQGHTKLPNGLMLQWGAFTHSGAGDTDIYHPLPTAFTTACVAVFVSTLASQQMGGFPNSLTDIRIKKGASDAHTRFGYFLAIGW